jgi:PIN domain nuclease of toxin-antitoxin system
VNGPPLLDTHIWVWWILRDRRIASAAVERLDRLPPEDRPYVADISLWEVTMLIERRRLRLDAPVGEWLALATHGRTLRVVPISAAIAAETHVARALRDPADRLIVATSRVLGVPLFTHDRNILRSRLVQPWAP